MQWLYRCCDRHWIGKHGFQRRHVWSGTYYCTGPNCSIDLNCILNHQFSLLTNHSVSVMVNIHITALAGISPTWIDYAGAVRDIGPANTVLNVGMFKAVLVIVPAPTAVLMWTASWTTNVFCWQSIGALSRVSLPPFLLCLGHQYLLHTDLSTFATSTRSWGCWGLWCSCCLTAFVLRYRIRDTFKLSYLSTVV